MKTYHFEARQGPHGPNWGKFMIGIPGGEWAWQSEVEPGFPLLRTLGWGPEHIWICDLQTGEGFFIRPGGSAHADLEKHAVWCCPLFEPWLEWLYGRLRETGIEGIADLPRVVDLPDAEFAFAGYRRPGPDQVTIPRMDLSVLLAAAAVVAGEQPVPELLAPLVAEVAERYKVRLEVT